MTRLVPEIEGFRRTPMEFVEGGPGGVIEAVSYRDGAGTVIAMAPGLPSWDTVTLRRTGAGSPALWKWWKAAVDGTVQRRTVLVRLVDDRGGPMGAWTLKGCWPTRWRLVERTDRQGESTHVEEVTLAVEDVDLA